jgi:hypothetical protein
VALLLPECQVENSLISPFLANKIALRGGAACAGIIGAGLTGMGGAGSTGIVSWCIKPKYLSESHVNLLILQGDNYLWFGTFNFFYEP